jgi:hypothetical protein
MENFKEELSPALLRAANMYRDAAYLKRLNIFRSSEMPEDAYNLWSLMTKGGTKLRTGRIPNESPKITFKRFIKRKVEEFDQKQDEFMDKYGFDWRKIDLDKSDSMGVKDFKGDTIAP